MTSPFLIPFSIIFVGLSALVGGFLYRRRLQSRESEYKRIPAKVIDHIKRLSNSGSVVCYPVVEYFVGDVRFTLTGTVGRSRKWERKAKVKLTAIFNPANPVKAHLLEDYYFWVIWILGFGAAFVAMGMMTLIVLIAFL